MQIKFHTVCSLMALGVSIVSGQASAASKGCTVKSTDYFGWRAEQIANAWTTLTIVPQLGGRLMQVTFNGHDFLFVNEQLKGKYLPPDVEHHRWYNYGGDKVWPMPEGSGDEQHWPGAGGSMLDDLPYSAEATSRGAVCTVRLTGPSDSFTGQQYIRDISLSGSSPVISFHSVMKNTSGYPQSWSEQSVSQYNTAAPDDTSKVNPKIWGLTSANPASQYLNGYHIRTGVISSQAYLVEDGLFKVHPVNSGGEVWIDSPGGWLAVADGASNYTMVERIRYQPTATYPDKATMIFFTTGGQRSRPSTDPAQADRPPVIYMEAEVNSPVVELMPGESYAMDTQWLPTRGGESLKAVRYPGIVEEPLRAVRSNADVTLNGLFGSFYAGALVAHFYGRGGEPLGTLPAGEVEPEKPVTVNLTIRVPPATERISVHLVDNENVDRGPFGETALPPAR